jgi:hypothetical protein
VEVPRRDRKHNPGARGRLGENEARRSRARREGKKDNGSPCRPRNQVAVAAFALAAADSVIAARSIVTAV